MAMMGDDSVNCRMEGDKRKGIGGSDIETVGGIL